MPASRDDGRTLPRARRSSGRGTEQTVDVQRPFVPSLVRQSAEQFVIYLPDLLCLGSPGESIAQVGVADDPGGQVVASLQDVLTARQGSPGRPPCRPRLGRAGDQVGLRGRVAGDDRQTGGDVLAELVRDGDVVVGRAQQRGSHRSSPTRGIAERGRNRRRARVHAVADADSVGPSPQVHDDGVAPRDDHQVDIGQLRQGLDDGVDATSPVDPSAVDEQRYVVSKTGQLPYTRHVGTRRADRPARSARRPVSGSARGRDATSRPAARRR